MISRPRHVVIIGGGITGLSAAYAVMEEAKKAHASVQCTVLEQDSRWGGKILTHATQDLLMEAGPDSFLTTKPAAIELCRALGLESRLLPTNAEHNQTFAFCRGKLRELPQGLLAFRPQRVDHFMRSGVLSVPGMLRMGAERFWPRPTRLPADESMSEFFSRRFGAEAFHNLLEPLVAGIYAGDAQELSIQATFPRFRELERDYGSVIKGMRALQARPPKNLPSSSFPMTMFMSLRGGLGELTQALTGILGAQKVHLRLGETVQYVEPAFHDDDSHRIFLRDGQCLVGDALIVTTPAYSAAKILEQACPEFATILNDIPYASTATVSLAYQAESIRPLIRGFGFVVPRKEQRALLAATWSSLKWQGRSKAGEILVRTYVGGRGRDIVLEKEDQEIGQVIQQELAELVGVTAKPHFMEVNRWHRGMPQYVLGHQERLSSIASLLQGKPRLYLAGAAYRGIGIPDCIKDGMQAGKEAIQGILGDHAPVSREKDRL